MTNNKRLLIIDDSECGVDHIKKSLPSEGYIINSIAWEINDSSKQTVSDNFHFLWHCIKVIIDYKPDILLISNNMSHHSVKPSERTDEGLHLCVLMRILKDYFGFIPPKIISTSSYNEEFLRNLYKDTDVKHFPGVYVDKIKECLESKCGCK